MNGNFPVNEKLSQLVDGELDDFESEQVLDALTKDAGSQRGWGIYHLIGDVMRGEVDQVGTNLAGRIEQTLSAEPTVLRFPAADEVKDENRREQKIVKPAAIFTIAASVLIFAILMFSPQDNDQVIPDPDSLASAPADIRQMDALTQEFEGMLANHGEFTATPGLNGLIAYVKFVSKQEPQIRNR